MKIKNFLRTTRAATIIEYALLLFMLLGVGTGAVYTLGVTTDDVFEFADSQLDDPSSDTADEAGPVPGTGPSSVAFDPSTFTLTDGTVQLPAGTVGFPYGTGLAPFVETVEADISDVSWAISTGSLDTGLSLGEATGLINGTPVTAGSYTFDVTVGLPEGATDTQSFALDVFDPVLLSFDTSGATMNGGAIVLPDAYLGEIYSQELDAFADVSGVGVDDLAWSLSDGDLPVDVALGADSLVSGTPSVLGASTFMATMTAPSGVSQSQDFEITVVPPIVLAFDTSGATMNGDVVVLENGEATVPFTSDLTTFADVSGIDLTELSWSITAGALPTGLALDASGTSAGTPTTPQTTTFTATMTAPAGQTAEQEFELTIDPAPASVAFDTSGETMNGSSVVLASAERSVLYSEDLASYAVVSNGDMADASWSVASGAVPTGLALGSDGLLSGTPSASGTFTFEATALLPNGNDATQSFEVEITDPPVVAVWDTSGATMSGSAVVLPDIVRYFDESNYNVDLTDYLDLQNVTAEDLQWDVVNDWEHSVASQATISDAGVLSTTSSQLQTYIVQLRFMAPGQPWSATQDFEIDTVPQPTLTWNDNTTVLTLPSGVVGQPYTINLQNYGTLSSNGGPVSVEWADVEMELISPDMPSGLALSSSGAISGIATERNGDHTAIGAYLTSNGYYLGHQIFAISIDNPSITFDHVNGTYFSRPVMPNPQVGVPYYLDLKPITNFSHGVAADYVYGLGSLPDGLSVSANGIVSGTPTESGDSFSSISFAIENETISAGLVFRVQ